MNGRTSAHKNRPRALVSGGAGFIGSHITEALCARGWQVDALDNLSTGSAENIPAGVTLRIADVRSAADLRDAFSTAQFDAVVHCAAQTSVQRSMLDPDLDREVNVTGTRLLAAAAHAAGARRFVYLSSGGAVYGETATPANETSPPAPRSYYGRHKYAAEEIVRAEGLPHAILRPSNVYGARQRADAEGGVVAVFLQRLLTSQPLEIYGTGHQVRDFVHVSDVVAAVLTALAVDDDVLWNVASGEGASVLELAETMAALAQLPARITYQPRRAGDVDRSLLSAEGLLATGLWGPPLPLAEGLRLTLQEAARHLRSRPVPVSALKRSALSRT